MKTALWIARRFSFARKRFRIINVISAISLAGIIVGVSTLLIVMSVLNGFQKLAYDMFTTIEGEVQLVSRSDGGISVSDSLLQALASVEGVAAAEPFAEGEAIMSSGGGQDQGHLHPGVPQVDDEQDEDAGHGPRLCGPLS